MQRNVKKAIAAVAVALSIGASWAWDVEHDELAQLTGEFLPKEMREFFTFDDFGILVGNCHAPDEIEWPMPDGKRRYRNAAEIEAVCGPAVMSVFKACGFKDSAGWLHTPRARAAMLTALARSFAAGDSRGAAFCLSALTHAVADQSALNHPPLLQFVMYSRFDGVDYGIRKVEPGAKNVFGFRSDGYIVHRVRQLLKDFKPEAPKGALQDVAVDLVADEARQAAHSAEKEGVIAFAPHAEAEEALAQLVAMQVRILVTMAWTSWTNRAADAPLPAADFDARFSRIVERVTREIDPAKGGVFHGVFDESLNPENPKGHLHVVCEAYASPHRERLTYVGRMLGSAAARTARDDGWAVHGISFWRIADSDVLPKPGKGVKLLLPGGNRWHGAEKIADRLKAWREAGGELIYLAGADTRDVSGFGPFLEQHPDDEIPTSTQWGTAGAGDYRKMSLLWKGTRYPQKRCGSFTGFTKPICNLGIRPAPGVEEIARFDCGGKSFVAAARRGNVTWAPLYTLMPFFYSDDTTLNWSDMRLDSFASKFFLDLLNRDLGDYCRADSGGFPGVSVPSPR